MALPVLPLRVHQGLGLGSFLVGLVAGGQFAAAILSRAWAGRHADTHGPKHAVIAGLAIASVSGLIYFLSLSLVATPSASVGILLLGRALLGVGESFIITGGQSWALAILTVRNTSKALAWVGSAMFAAFAAGTPVGSALYARYGFGAIALTTLLLPLVTLLCVAPLRGVTSIPRVQAGFMKVLASVWFPGLGAAYTAFLDVALGFGTPALGFLADHAGLGSVFGVSMLAAIGSGNRDGPPEQVTGAAQVLRARVHVSAIVRGESQSMKLFIALLASSLTLMNWSIQAKEENTVAIPTIISRADIRAVAPALDKYTQERLLGEVWKRPGLNARDRSIVTVAALIARNQIELPYYLNLALDNGVRPSEISEIITHLAFYSGWPNAMSAVAAAKDVFAARKVSADQLSPTSEPLPLNEAAEADRAARVGQQFGADFPGIVQYTTDILFRDLWLRPGLAPRDRSLVTVAALIADGQVAQMPYHLNRAMDSGLTREQAGEVITHLAFYVGWPNAFSAMPVAKDVFEKRAKSSN
jgi:4-carboxymuconolactone decarboxylase